jgi:hypothetical protein
MSSAFLEKPLAYFVYILCTAEVIDVCTENKLRDSFVAVIAAFHRSNGWIQGLD